MKNKKEKRKIGKWNIRKNFIFRKTKLGTVIFYFKKYEKSKLLKKIREGEL